MAQECGMRASETAGRRAPRWDSHHLAPALLRPFWDSHRLSRNHLAALSMEHQPHRWDESNRPAASFPLCSDPFEDTHQIRTFPSLEQTRAYPPPRSRGSMRVQDGHHVTARDTAREDTHSLVLHVRCVSCVSCPLLVRVHMPRQKKARYRSSVPGFEAHPMNGCLPLTAHPLRLSHRRDSR